jgi:hypothetical protein
MSWRATARARGTGQATLHVRYYPVSAAGVVASTASAHWDLPFSVAGTGSVVWNDPAKDNDGLVDACQNQSSVEIKATISVAGDTVISAQSSPVSCTIIT